MDSKYLETMEHRHVHLYKRRIKWKLKYRLLGEPWHFAAMR